MGISLTRKPARAAWIHKGRTLDCHRPGMEVYRSLSRNEDITGLKVQRHMLVTFVTGFQPVVLRVNRLLFEEQPESLAAFAGQIVQMRSSPPCSLFWGRLYRSGPCLEAAQEIATLL